MTPAPSCIFIIGDDATSNLLASLVLKRFYIDPDIHFFADPESVLQIISETDNAIPTLVFIDTVTRGMSFRTFLKMFSELDATLQSNYTLYISLPENTAYRSLQQKYPAIGFCPKPITLSVLNGLAAKRRDEVSVTVPQHEETNPSKPSCVILTESL